MKVPFAIIALAATFGLAGCETPNLSGTTASSSIASAAVTEAGIEVVTTFGNNNVFERADVCNGQTYMIVGVGPDAERFWLTQSGTIVRVDGRVIEGLSCPPRSSGGGGGGSSRNETQGPTDEQSQDRSGAADTGDTGDAGADTGGGFGAISG